MAFDINDYGIGKRPLWAIFTSVLLLVVLVIFVLNCVAMGEGSRLLPIYSVETPDKKAAVTFNCAWGAEDIPEILAVLEKYEAKATFFILSTKRIKRRIRLQNERGFFGGRFLRIEKK